MTDSPATDLAPQSGYSVYFQKWRHASGQIWTDYTHHAFVEGLRDGSLPQDAFLHYLKQDYVFLVHFSRAWALAVVKSETLQEMKLASQTVDALVNHEMQLHVETCAKLGLSEQQLFDTTEASANLAYTRYVLEAGLQGDFLDLMAALAPCVLGYGEIGARLRKDHAPNTPYLDWIETYGGTEYQDVCCAVGDLIDTSLRHRLGTAPESLPRWAALQQKFTIATRLEVDFWQMGFTQSI